MPLVSPLLWEGLPFQHKDGEMDFLGMHDHWHRILGKTLGEIAHYPLDNLKDMGDIHQRMHDQLAIKLSLEKPADFSLYDLTQRQGWVLFMQAHSIEHERLRGATGL
jgi:hypothetical protein